LIGEILRLVTPYRFDRQLFGETPEKHIKARRQLAASSRQGARQMNSRLYEPTGFSNQSGTLGPAGEKEIQDGKICDEVPPQLGVNWGFIFVMNYPDSMAMEEFLVKILV
jgi:hypothetical protein